MAEWKKNILLHSYIFTMHNMHNKGGGRRFGMGVQNHWWESPSGVQGQSPGRGSGDKVPQKLKNFKSSYKQILRILVVIHTQYMKLKQIIENENYKAQL